MKRFEGYTIIRRWKSPCGVVCEVKCDTCERILFREERKIKRIPKCSGRHSESDPDATIGWQYGCWVVLGRTRFQPIPEDLWNFLYECECRECGKREQISRQNLYGNRVKCCVPRGDLVSDNGLSKLKSKILGDNRNTKKWKNPSTDD